MEGFWGDLKTVFTFKKLDLRLIISVGIEEMKKGGTLTNKYLNMVKNRTVSELEYCLIS